MLYKLSKNLQHRPVAQGASGDTRGYTPAAGAPEHEARSPLGTPLFFSAAAACSALALGLFSLAAGRRLITGASIPYKKLLPTFASTRAAAARRFWMVILRIL